MTELSQTVKGVLIKYSDNLMSVTFVFTGASVYTDRRATARTQAQMSDYTRAFVEKINPEKDTTLVTVHIPRLLALATPKPLYYDNFAVGECRDLIFGVSLVDYATAKGLADGEIPKIVRICIREIDQRGLEAEGIYRVSTPPSPRGTCDTNWQLGLWKTRVGTRGEHQACLVHRCHC